jgi:hypothetical protein
MINGGQRYLMVLIPMYQIGFITGQSSGLGCFARGLQEGDPRLGLAL